MLLSLMILGACFAAVWVGYWVCKNDTAPGTAHLEGMFAWKDGKRPPGVFATENEVKAAETQRSDQPARQALADRGKTPPQRGRRALSRSKPIYERKSRRSKS